MKKIDIILIYLLFLFGIFPNLNSFIPRWSEFLNTVYYFKVGIGAIDIILLSMLGLTIIRYINKQYRNYQKIGIGAVLIVFFIWMLFEIIRNYGKFGLSAPGEFRFRYLILVLPVFIAMNFNSFEARKKLARTLIKVGYFLPLLYIPVIGIMKGWTFGAENRFLNSQIYLGMIYSLTFLLISRKYNYLKFNKNVILISLIPFAFFFIIDSHRSAWLAAAVILGLLYYLKELKAGRIFRLIPFLIILGAIVIPLISDTGINIIKYVEQRGSAFYDPSSDPTSEWRMMMWSLHMDKFFSSPIIGEGFGEYWYVVFPNGQVVNVSPHSYYVQTLVKVGIIGMALWVFIIFKIFFRIKKFLEDARRKFNPELPIIILSFCVLITMHVYYIVYSLEYYSLMYLGLAIAVMLDRKNYLNE